MGVGGSDGGGGGMGNVVQRVGGVVKSEVKEKMGRMLFRVSRGNALVVFNEIEEPMLADAAVGGAAAVSKHAFVVVVSSEVLERKVRKVMEAFDANKYELPENVAECERLLAEGRAQHDEQREMVERNGQALRAALLRLASETASWKRAVRREKATYHTLNLFRAPEQGKGGGGGAGGGTLDAELGNGGSSRFEAEGWVVSSALPAVRQAVLEAHREMPSVVETVHGRALPTPPTHFALNKFSAGFQALVDTYGVPRYREANPALFTAITFPFLFGVMYGDVGHGSCLLLFGLLLVATEKAKEGKVLGELEGGLHLARYMILLMGVFAVYSGFIYNDFFGLGLDLGEGSRWQYPAGPNGEPAEVGTPAKTVGAGGAVQPDCGYENKTGAAMVPGASCPQDGNVYPFGLDPMWHTASNELLMANSLKMKMSVILGITQMVAGILLKGANCLHVGDRVSFFLDFLPQLVFASALFVYMIVLILVKWSIDWRYRMALVTPTSACPAELGGCQPPNLITTLINIVLKIGDVTDPMYEGQAGTQTFLVLMCVLSVPVMLCGKPLYLRWENQRNPRVPVLIDEHDGGMDQAETSFVRHGSDADEHGPPGGHGHGHGPFDFGELMIHQGIETIEFVLGMVSNTASYLRLWALSLAHTELAGVFWHKVMLVAINTRNPFFIFIGACRSCRRDCCHCLLCVARGSLLVSDPCQRIAPLRLLQPSPSSPPLPRQCC
jgi:V-type H+-transporting ATPase subunit a